jgi:palmitoyltransferase
MTLFGLRPPCPFDSLEDLAIPAVSFLIIFLAYTPQYLFYYIEPGPLTKTEAIWFNLFVFGIWWCYDRACFVDAGPKRWVDKAPRIAAEGEHDGQAKGTLNEGKRWCKKCDAPKPPRAHHCRKCGRYIISFSSLTAAKDKQIDVSRKWITTAHGLQTASHTLHSPISSALSSTP